MLVNCVIGLQKFVSPWRQVFSKTEISPPRRYELDWLRVLAFGMLIFYHTGMLYSQNWGFHFKSQYLSLNVENAMLLLSPWRMALIWFISGAALRFIVARSSFTHFITSRSILILLPLLAGVWLIVPVQLYAEMSQKSGLNLGFWQFYRAFFDLSHPIFSHYQAGIWPHVDVNHLWYLRSLWQFTLLLVLILPLLHLSKVQALITHLCEQSPLIIFMVLLLPLCALKLSWPSETFRYPMGALFLLYGYLLAWQSGFYSQLKRHWRTFLILFVVGYLLVIIGYHVIWQNPIAQQWKITSMDMLYTAQRLLGVMLMLALAQRFLNHDHPILTKLNSAVFPFYILHQSMIIGLAFWLTPLQLGPVWEPVVIICVTFFGCWLFFEIVRRIDIICPLFGIKPSQQYSAKQRRVVSWIGLLLISPLVLELLT
ncbi:acyltransferase family protein [Pseudoalteromonas ulvae]|uniref:acyltransferase family protein n=1 Tax=Pseudoalteromonas ulvae TaxID=107327 RepID=UPI00186B7938|nr:acyltransferase [Pseudoalteromonas ulvae]